MQVMHNAVDMDYHIVRRCTVYKGTYRVEAGESGKRHDPCINIRGLMTISKSSNI